MLVDFMDMGITKTSKRLSNSFMEEISRERERREEERKEGSKHEGKKHKRTEGRKRGRK